MMPSLHQKRFLTSASHKKHHEEFASDGNWYSSVGENPRHYKHCSEYPVYFVINQQGST